MRAICNEFNAIKQSLNFAIMPHLYALALEQLNQLPRLIVGICPRTRRLKQPSKARLLPFTSDPLAKRFHTITARLRDWLLRNALDQRWI